MIENELNTSNSARSISNSPCHNHNWKSPWLMSDHCEVRLFGIIIHNIHYSSHTSISVLNQLPSQRNLKNILLNHDMMFRGLKATFIMMTLTNECVHSRIIYIICISACFKFYFFPHFWNKKTNFHTLYLSIIFSFRTNLFHQIKICNQLIFR